MTGLYLLAGIAALWLYGRAFLRRVRDWRKRRDSRSRRELIEAGAFLFVAGNILALTVGGLIELPRAWLVAGAAATVGAFVVAGWVLDQEDSGNG